MAKSKKAPKTDDSELLTMLQFAIETRRAEIAKAAVSKAKGRELTKSEQEFLLDLVVVAIECKADQEEAQRKYAEARDHFDDILVAVDNLRNVVQWER